MAKNRILNQLNLGSQCRRYGLSIWQCPHFIFLVMGFVIIVVSLTSYLIGARYIDDPSSVTLVVLTITAILFILGFIITRSFEQLAQVSRMKSEFIDIVSHQLRSPITNIKWATSLLSSEEAGMNAPKKREYFGNLKENINRLVELVDELLIVSKIEQKAFLTRKKTLSLEELIRETVSQYKVFAEASNVGLEFHCQENLAQFFSEPNLIKLVVENLIDNAIHYTRKGGKVKINLKEQGKNFYFEIKDSGVGIPKEDQKYIFQKFFRAEGILKEQIKGSGLGLYTTKLIIKQLGGRIWFESKEGEGTTFYFTLPR